MNTNQLLVSILQKIAACMIAGLFGFAAMNLYDDMTQKVMFKVDESIVGKSYIDESGVITTLSAHSSVSYSETTVIDKLDVYTRDVLKESGMNSILTANTVERIYIAAAETQEVVNPVEFKPPRESMPRSDIINSS